MKASFKFLPLVVATFVAFVGSASAQVITDTETRSSYSGSVVTFGGAGSSQGELFSNVSAVTSMTYSFFAGSGGSTATTLTAVFGQWNGSGFVGGTTVDFGTINIPAFGGAGWGTFMNGATTYNSYEKQFDLTSLSASYPSMVDATYGYLTSSTNTYALMLTNTGAATGLGLGLIFSDVFPYGASSISPGFDFAFSQIVVYGGDQSLITAVPESSTVASVAVGLMVVGLVGFRMNQRRRAIAAPVVAA